MNSLEQQVIFYIDRLDGEAREDAFHSLIEFPPTAVPIIIQTYQNANGSNTQVAIIEVLGHFRDSQSIDFLKSTLADNNPDIWKTSLDSLVSIGKEALSALKNSLDNEESNDKIEWIAEAIN